MMTERFRMSQRRMLLRLFSLYGRPWLIGMALMVIGLAIWAIAVEDVRILICALIVVFIVVPMVIAILYINHSLSPDVAFNVLPHTLKLTDTGVELTVFKKRTEDDAHERQADKTGAEKEPEFTNSANPADSGTTGSVEEEESFNRIIPYSYFGKYVVGAECVYLEVGKHGFMYLPLGAFKGPEEMREFLADIAGRRDGRV